MSDIQAIRERHEKCAFTVTKTEWTEREAFNAHTDRATLLSALTAAEARAEAAEARLKMLEELCELMMPIMEAAATKGIPMPPGWEARLRDLHARTLKGNTE